MQQDPLVMALESLDKDPELASLEEIYNSFNIFIALKIDQYELRHSSFIAWLINPGETHRLRSSYTFQFFMVLAVSATLHLKDGPTLEDIGDWDMDSIKVISEFTVIKGRPDLVAYSDTNQFVLVLENKISAKEHLGQTELYKEQIDAIFPESYTKWYAYLTPTGESAEDPHYIPISYQAIADSIGMLLKTKGYEISPKVQILIKDYIDVLERCVMEKSEIMGLCTEVYQKHKKVLSDITVNLDRRDQYIKNQIIAGIKDLVVIDHSSKKFIFFITESLEFIRTRNEKNKWTKTGRPLLFSFHLSYKTGLWFKLEIGPYSASIRKELIRIAKADFVFKVREKTTGGYTTIFSEKLLDEKEYIELSVEKVADRAITFLKAFSDDQLLACEECFIRERGFIERVL